MWQGSFLMISWLVCVVKLLSSAVPALRFHSPLSCFNHIALQALCREEWTQWNQETWSHTEEAGHWRVVFFFCRMMQTDTARPFCGFRGCQYFFSAFFLPSCHFCLPLSFSTFLWPSSAALLHTSLRVPLRSSSDTSLSARRENLHTPLHEYIYTATCYRKGWL